MASPPGYNPSVGQVYTESSKENDSNMLIIKKSWDLALGPLKQVSFVYLMVNISSVEVMLDYHCSDMKNKNS